MLFSQAIIQCFYCHFMMYYQNNGNWNTLAKDWNYSSMFCSVLSILFILSLCIQIQQSTSNIFWQPVSSPLSLWPLFGNPSFVKIENFWRNFLCSLLFLWGVIPPATIWLRHDNGTWGWFQASLSPERGVELCPRHFTPPGVVQSGDYPVGRSGESGLLQALFWAV